MADLVLGSGNTVKKIVIHNGFAGEDGKDGSGFKDASIINGELILTKDDDTKINLGKVTGAKGDADKDGVSINGKNGFKAAAEVHRFIDISKIPKDMKDIDGNYTNDKEKLNAIRENIYFMSRGGHDSMDVELRPFYVTKDGSVKVLPPTSWS